ncbi:hypothetical protein ACFL1B_00810 [Nanoarchaeota archaeon]
MKHLKILNTREVKQLMKHLEIQFGFTKKLGYAFLRSNKGRIYLVTRDIAGIDLDELRIDSMGNYFATEEPDGLRLSIEGSQLVGPDASKGIVELDDAQFNSWFKGSDIDVDDNRIGFCIVKHKEDFIGCGKLGSNILRNYVPKTRRILIDI